MLKRYRVDSVAKLRERKTRAQLQKENEQLTAKVRTLEGQVEDTQMALCDVYEQMMEVMSLGQNLCRSDPQGPQEIEGCARSFAGGGQGPVGGGQ